MKSDEELFHGFQRGETDCFEQLVLRYRRKLTCYIYRIIADADAAEDVAQDVFAYLYVYPEKYRDGYPLSSFLYTLAHRRSVDYIRKHHRQVPSDLSSLDGEDAALTPDDTLDASERKIAVAKAMNALKAEYREVLYLIYFEELSHKEAARILGKTQPQVKVMVHRARKALGVLLEREGYRHEN